MSEVEQEKNISVVAISRGYYNSQIKEEGDKFSVKSAQELSPRWMKRVDGKKIVKMSKAVADKQHPKNGVASFFKPPVLTPDDLSQSIAGKPVVVSEEELDEDMSNVSSIDGAI